jgi:hypothetical protein
MVECYSMACNPINITHLMAEQSPVPYLIGVVAALIGLVTFALLILVCSFKKQSGLIEESNSGGHYNNTAAAVESRQVEESNSGAHDNNTAAVVECLEKKIEICREDTDQAKVIVIMAGDEKPTFLAEPAMLRARDN